MKFHIFAYGDRTVGDGDHHAVVDIPYMNEDAEYVADTRDILRTAFAAIFDNRHVTVVTGPNEQPLVHPGKKG